MGQTQHGVMRYTGNQEHRKTEDGGADLYNGKPVMTGGKGEHGKGEHGKGDHGKGEHRKG